MFVEGDMEQGIVPEYILLRIMMGDERRQGKEPLRVLLLELLNLRHVMRLDIRVYTMHQSQHTRPATYTTQSTESPDTSPFTTENPVGFEDSAGKEAEEVIGGGRFTVGESKFHKVAHFKHTAKTKVIIASKAPAYAKKRSCAVKIQKKKCPEGFFFSRKYLDN